MPRDAFVDNYITKAAPFAQPILMRLRALVHAHCPDAQETRKWGAPAFVWRGKTLALMAGFKAHATFGFFRGDAAVNEKARDAMGNFGKLKSLDDVPDEAEFARLCASAMAMIEAGVSPPRKHAPKPGTVMHPAFDAALNDEAEARKTFAALPPSQQREYLEWIGDAKRDETRMRRIEKAIRLLIEGKDLNWKYRNC